MRHPRLTGSAGVLALFLGPGCGAIAVLEEGTGGAGGSTSTNGSAGTKGSSALTSSATKSSSQTGMPDLCHASAGTACDPGTFPQCSPEQVSGIPCCYITKTCGPLGVGWEFAACTDDCAQNCELIQNPEHCPAVPWCILGPNGCELAPPPP
jgi:hypothetical protein